MKKYIGLVFAFVCSSLLVFSSCGSSSSLSGEFEESEYILSLGENVDLLENFSCKGFAIGDMKIEFSRDDLLKFDSESGKYTSVKTGEASAWAVVQGQTVATTKIFVKESFSSVQEISLSADGVLSWQESYVIYSGVKVVARNYLLVINDQEFTTDTNSYTLSERGVYNIKIKALGSESDKIDESRFSNAQTFHFKVMPELASLSVQTSSEYNNHNVRVSWDAVDRAVYRVKVDGFVVEERLIRDEFTFSMKNYAGGDTAFVEIEVVDSLGENISSLKAFSITKLQAPNLSYDALDGEGKITFGNLTDASEYFAHVVNLQTNEEHFLEASDFTKLGGQISTFVNGIGYGVYSITVQAKGQGLHANSNSSEALTFIKLAVPEVNFSVEGNTLRLQTEKDRYVEKYKVTYAGKEEVWDINENPTLTLDIADLNAGEFDLSVVALPKIVDGNVSGIVIGSITTSRVVNSDSFDGKFYVLDEIGEISHSHDKASNTSKISFTRPANSDKFTLTLGNAFTSDNFSINGDKVEFVISDLARFASSNGEYNFTISAMRDDGHSTLVTKNKTLKVLGTVTASIEQENGYFTWNALKDVDADKIEYRYEIYEADKDYNITANLVASASTKDTITEKLSYGFYVIKVYSISLDTNLYLDSNFETDTFFSQGFHVYEQISSPKVTFFEDGGAYKLKIEKAEHASRYDIFVDGVSNGNLINDTASTLIYTFQNQDFGTAKEYKISVVASAPNNSTLHPQSEESVIKVTRLAPPSFDSKKTNVEFDKTGNKIHEKLSLSLIDHADKIEIYNGSELLGNDVFSKNVLDFISFKQNEITLDFKYVALEGSENEVYLDSLLARHTFKRMTNPSNIVYNNGDITFTNVSGADVEKFVAFITLVNDNPEQNYTVRHDFTGIKFDLSEFINNIQNDETIGEAFASNYLQASSIEVIIYAYATSDDKLPSDKGATFAGNDRLSLEKLDKTSLSFDNSTQILSWKAVGAGNLPTQYDIYIDGKLWKENFEATSINFNYETIDFLTKKTIYIVAKNSSYLDSARSDEIEISRLAGVETVNVSLTTNNKWVLGFTISDVANVAQVIVNGENIFLSNQTSYSLELASLDEDISIQVISKSGTNVISSFERTFTLVNLSKVSIKAEIENGNLVWEDVANNFIASENKKPLTYTVTVFDKAGNATGTISGLTDSQIALNDIASRLGVNLGSGEYSIQISSSLVAYSLSQEGGFTKGYFGQAQSDKMALSKLESVDKISLSLAYGEEKLEIDRILNAKAVLSWANLWDEYDDVNFDVTIGSTFIPNITTDHGIANYNLTLDEEGYHLSLNNSLFGQNTEISVVVNYNKAISSDVTKTTFERMKNPSQDSISINREGILTFPFENDDYIIKYEIGNVVGEVKTSKTDGAQSATLNLLDIFGDMSGQYKVEILAFDKNGLALSPANKSEISGTRLGAMDSVAVDDYGKITIQATPDRDTINVLAVKKVSESQEKSIVFSLDREEGVFTITLNSLIEKFSSEHGQIPEGLSEFKLALMEEGSLPSPYKDLQFKYNAQTDDVRLARGRNEAENFIVIRKDALAGVAGAGLTLTSFDFVLSFTDLVELTGENEEISFELRDIFTSKQYLASALAGYWIIVEKDENGNALKGYFDTVKPSTIPDSDCEECYGIDLALLLEEVDYGKVNLKVSRVAKETVTDNGIEKTIYTQFASKEQQLTKLNSASEFKFVSGQKATLAWQWFIKNVNDDQSNETDLAEKTGYYIFLTDTENGGEEAIFASSESLDIFERLNSEISYEISIVAVSNNEQVIASNRTFIPQKFVRKIKSPTKVTVENGRIVFDKSSFENSLANIDFVKYFIDNRTDPSFVDNYVNQTFKDLFVFSANDIENQEVRLTLRNETNNSVYTTRIKAYQLIPDLSEVTFTTSEGTQGNFLNLFMQTANAVGTETSEPHRALRKMLSYITTSKNSSGAVSNNGVADNKILFDDLGLVDGLGNEIPAGRYEISISQYADVSRGGNSVESNQSSAHSVSVTAGTPYRLGKEGDNYYAEFSTVDGNFDTENHQALTTAYSYTMVLRVDEDKTEYNFGKRTEHTFRIVSNDEGQNWTLQYVYEDGTIGIVTNGLLTAEQTNSVRLNLTTIARLSFIEKKIYTVEIFAGGSNYAVNGKSGKFTLELLDLKDFRFENGELSWSASANAYSKVETKRAGQIWNTTEIPILASERIKLNLNSAGDYTYVLLSLMGSCGRNTISVDSEKYLIENISKLSAPNLTVSDNSLAISTNESQIDEYSYKISNNKAKESQPEKSYVTTATNHKNIIYHPGLLGLGENDYKRTESGAENFYVSLLGNSGEVNSTKRSGTIIDTNLSYQFVLSLKSGEHFLLTSNESNLNGKMLNTIDSGTVSLNQYGDIVWIDSDDVQLEEEGQIYYNVIVNGFESNSSNDRLISSQTFITSEKSLDTSLININGATAYSFTIQKVAYKESSTITSIQSVDGKYLSPAGVKYADGKYVLASEYISSGKFTRSAGVVNVRTDENTIQFVDTRTTGNPKFLVYAKASGDNAKYELIGDSTNNALGEFSTSSGTPRTITFTANAGAFTGENPYTILIYAVESGNLKSLGASLTQVFKLPKVESKHFKISFVSASESSYTYSLDMTEYFSDVSIMMSNKVYQVEAKFSYGEETQTKILTFTSDDMIQTFTIGGNSMSSTNLKLTFTVVARGEQSLNIISSDVSDEINLSEESWNDEKISWDNENKIFSWGSEDVQTLASSSEEIEYRVTVTYLNNFTQSIITKNKYFAPTLVGTIDKIEVRFRNSPNSLFSEAQILSKGDEFPDGFVFDLFDGGDGSVQNPYTISSSEQFDNILKRNESGVNFVLTSDISITDIATQSTDTVTKKPNLKASISGLKQGGGKHTLTISPSINEKLVTETFVSGNSTVSYNFNGYISLFNQIEAGAEMKDLDIVFNAKFPDSKELTFNNVMFAPLAFQNYGRIENCLISSIAVSGSISSSKNIAVGGLVVYNHGEITQCENSFSGNLLAGLSARSGYNVIYGGLAICNGSVSGVAGTISHSFNRGEVSIIVPYANTSQRIAGIVVNNYGTIQECGNDGNIAVTGQTAGVSTYIAGISLRVSARGQIKNSFNNTSFQSATSGGSAGIVYLLEGGTLNGLIDTSSITMVKSGQSNKVSNCYRLASAPMPVVSVLTLDENTNISCSDGHTLKVVKNGNNYTALIV